MVCVPDPDGGMRPHKSQGQRKLKTGFVNLRRLMEGRPPYGYGDRWPDGAQSDVIRRVYTLRPTSFESDARFFVPDEEDDTRAL